MMRLFSKPSIITGIGLAVFLSITCQAQGRQQSDESVTVTKTYDNVPFDYRIRLLSEHDGFRIYRLTYPSPVATANEPNNTIPAHLYLPSDMKPGDAKRPAVICLHVLDGNMKASEFACATMALRGIPALMFWLPYYGERQTPAGWRVLLEDPHLFLSAVSQSIKDVRRTVDVLGSRPEINPDRIGLIGFSLGGIIAASAAGAEPRLHRTALFAAGGDVLEIVHYARYTRRISEAIKRMSPEERADLEKHIEAVEPLRFAGALRERAQDGRVMMFNAVDDGIIPRSCTDRLAEALGIADRVQWLNHVDHDTFLGALPRMTHTVVDFFARDLPPGVKAYDGTSTPPSQFVGLMRQMAAMLAADPEPGCCHRLEMQVALRGMDRKEPLDGSFKIIRGAAHRFVLRCTLPAFGDVLIGQGQFPWMVVAGNHVLAGVKHPVDDRNPLRFADKRHFGKLQMIGAILDGLSIAPDAIGQWATVEVEKSAEGRRAVHITAKQNLPANMTVALRDDGATPDRVAFDIFGRSGTISIQSWQYGVQAENAEFEPPIESVRHKVDQTDLYRIFSVVFNLFMESLS